MPSTRDIRRRIKSVKNTRQITKAMELVAASKMKRAQQSALAGHAYAMLMSEMLGALESRIEGFEHPFLTPRPVKTRGIMLITTDKGLCGPLNSNLFRLVTEIKEPATFVTAGRKGAQFISRTKRNLAADFPISDKVNFSEVREPAQFLTKLFLDGTIDTVEVMFSWFKNTLVQVPIVLPLLPIANLHETIAAIRRQKGIAGDSSRPDSRQMLIEPSAAAVLESLLPLYVNREIHQCMLDAKASEHSARMVAMKTAKDNASSLLDDLTLEYNKARQAAITQEILEIAAAQMASAGQ
ncbi:MAG TPA: ATP synthase F1 subunit gamma [Opitutaceae bacterium]|nr:ATP synthase F1 subunit gamma [Opitutaceae bacterium]